MLKIDNHIFQGLQLDADPLRQKPETLVEAKNIRISSRGIDTELTITNERGTELISLKSPTGEELSIKGQYVGHGIITKYVVIFTHEEASGDTPKRDHIYRIDSTNFTIIDFLGSAAVDFNFDPTHPIECYPYYESLYIQKLYWIDGINPIRYINVTKDLFTGIEDISKLNYTNVNYINATPTLKLNEVIKVTKNFNSLGKFAAGTIQYAVTYYNKYGAESGIAWVSPLYYTSFKDRAGSPEETIPCSFELNFFKTDTSFEYLRIYSIFRSSLNGTPVVKIVGELSNDLLGSRYTFDYTAPLTELSVHPSNVYLIKKIGGDKVRLTDAAYIYEWEQLDNKLKWPVRQKTAYYKVNAAEYSKIIDSYNNTEYSIPADALYIYAPTTPVQCSYRNLGEEESNIIPYYRWCIFARDEEKTYPLEQLKSQNKIEYFTNSLSKFRIAFQDGISHDNAIIIDENTEGIVLANSSEVITLCGAVSSIHPYYKIKITADNKNSIHLYYIDSKNEWRRVSLNSIQSDTDSYLYISKEPEYFKYVANKDAEGLNPRYILFAATGRKTINLSSELDYSSKIRSNRFVLPFGQSHYVNSKDLSFIDTEDRYDAAEKTYRLNIDYDRRRADSGRPWVRSNSGSSRLILDNNILVPAINSNLWVSGNKFVWDLNMKNQYDKIKNATSSTYTPDNIYPNIIGLDSSSKAVTPCLDVTDYVWNINTPPTLSYKTITEKGGITYEGKETFAFLPNQQYYYQVYLNKTPSLKLNSSEAIDKHVDFMLNNLDSDFCRVSDTNSLESLTEEEVKSVFSNKEKVKDIVTDDGNSNIIGLKCTFVVDEEPIINNSYIIRKSEYPNACIRIFYNTNNSNEDWAYFDITFAKNTSDDAVILISQSVEEVLTPVNYVIEKAKAEIPNFRIEDITKNYWAVAGSPDTNGGLVDFKAEQKDNGENVATQGYVYNVVTEEELKEYENRGIIKYTEVFGLTEEALTLPKISILPILKESKVLTLQDANISTVLVDPTYLLYLNSDIIIPKTLTSKDNTLFIGNIKTMSLPVEEFGEIIDTWKKTRDISIDKRVIYPTSTNIKNYFNSLTSYNALSSLDSPKTFKRGEYYRLGIQFQYNTGKWSDPLYLKDVKIPYKLDAPSMDANGALELLSLTTDIDLTKLPKEYLKARALVVLPNPENRSVLGQGVASPTVYSIYNRKNNAPYGQASWCFRPAVKNIDEYIYVNKKHDFNNGGYVEYRDGHLLFPETSRGAEIQGIHNNEDKMTGKLLTSKGTIDWEYINNKGSDILYDAVHMSYSKGVNINNTTALFGIDGTLITINTPDIEDIQTSATSISVMNVGQVTFPKVSSRTTGHLSLETASGGISADSRLRITDLQETVDGASRTMYAGPYYYDGFVDDAADGIYQVVGSSEGGLLVYPWHANVCLNNDNRGRSGVTAVLKEKCFVWYRQSLTTKWLDIDNQGDSLGYSGEATTVTDSSYYTRLSEHNYYGNVDTAITPPILYTIWGIAEPKGETNNMTGLVGGSTWYNDRLDITIHVYDSDYEDKLPNNTDKDVYYRMPKSFYYLGEASYGQYDISYLTSYTECKAVIGNPNDLATKFRYTMNLNAPWYITIGGELVNSEANLTILNSTGTTAVTWSSAWFGDHDGNIRYREDSIRMKYKSTDHLVVQLNRSMEYAYTNNNAAFFNVMDVYIPVENAEAVFGPSTDNILQQHTWLPAGEAITINREENATTHIIWKWGDTFYQPWECLKTYPFSTDDQNQVIDILSFMVESRINLDGRYDRNRGQNKNVSLSPTNFNLRNTAYDQLDNYFSYHVLPKDMNTINNYPTTYAWSLQKAAGAVIDNWLSINLNSSTTLDGSLGELNALVTYNDKLLAFQDRGISNILFNSRVQIQTNDEVPIQISNNYKVDGQTYLSNTLGCINKWTICSTSEGLYFIDTTSQNLYQLGSKGMVNLSKELLCTSWFSTRKANVWHEELNAGLRVFYDSRHSDVYITDGNELSLVYNENLKQFTSFMSYDNLVGIINSDNQVFALSDSYSQEEETKPLRFWRMFTGKYNSLFDIEYAPYSISFISNAESTAEKIFSTINVRADWSDDNSHEYQEFFDTMRVSNEYQDTGIIDFSNCFYNEDGSKRATQSNSRANLRKKFRVWRAEIPRDKKEGRRSRDRIRNMWCRIDFTHNSHTNTMMRLHDLSTLYFLNSGI